MARIARALGVAGSVRNDTEGVVLVLHTDRAGCDALLARLWAELPRLARIEHIERNAFRETPPDGFLITPSGRSGNVRTEVVPDATTCPQCLLEIAEPMDRRFGHAFASCTECGPRYTITETIPYDRDRTTMADFPMCADCAVAYADEGDRRHHAQPIACPACGPRLWWRDLGTGDAMHGDAACLERAAEGLVDGHIVAAKGLGGYQLLCDATSSAAVARLRDRKRRPHQPFAVLFESVETARACVRFELEAEQLLTGPEGPIVLLEHVVGSGIASEVAPDQRRLGAMLPTTPLHHLLSRRVGRPLVCTSGNLHSEPQSIDDADAVQKFAGVADAILGHDRRIAHRADDSVAAPLAGRMRMVRRARGYGPSSIELPAELGHASSWLACGADRKAAFALSRDARATLAPHLGELTHPAAMLAYESTLPLFSALHGFTPEGVVVDAHPDYASSDFGARFAKSQRLPLERVGHHHAHIAACLAENQWSSASGPVLGVALDGLGYGDDGTLWGGEFLVCDYASSERVAALEAVALLGGDRAARAPWRSLYAHLRAAMSWDEIGAFADVPSIRALMARRSDVFETMLERGLGAPPASSCGRLFDAVARALDVRGEEIAYEAEAAMALEALVDPRVDEGMEAYPFSTRADDVVRLSAAPMWPLLLEDVRRGVPVSVVSGRFHSGLARAVAELAIERASVRGIGTVALSGGCFLNRWLLEAVVDRLEAAGLRVLLHERLPPHDGCLALGQLAIAAARA